MQYSSYEPVPGAGRIRRTFRVIGTTRNVDDRYAAFGVTPQDAYYLAPDQRVHIW